MNLIGVAFILAAMISHFEDTFHENTLWTLIFLIAGSILVAL